MIDDLISCPWCTCTFVTQEDLDAHLKALKVLGTPVNEWDHRRNWKELIEKRKRYYYEEE